MSGRYNDSHPDYELPHFPAPEFSYDLGPEGAFAPTGGFREFLAAWDREVTRAVLGDDLGAVPPRRR